MVAALLSALFVAGDVSGSDVARFWIAIALANAVGKRLLRWRRSA